ncbi:MAG: hypothetical protein C0443_05255 [Comamonadaceae bacterium]|nr:hypothetical protein [Comamonadaceae bacterium]
MSAAPGRPQASSHRSPQGEGTPVNIAPTLRRCAGRWPCRPRRCQSQRHVGLSEPAQAGSEPQPSAPRGLIRLGAARRRIVAPLRSVTCGASPGLRRCAGRCPTT